MSRLIITTVGTSIITNYLENHGGRDDYERNIENRQLTNAHLDDQLGQLENFIGRVKRRAHDNFPHNLPATSAELASLRKMFDTGKFAPDQDRLLLLYTDTLDGAIAARVLAAIMEEAHPGIDLRQYRLRGVVSDRARNFALGLQEMSQHLDQEVQNMAEIDGLAFNITGGYKGTIPALTLYCYRLSHIDDKCICYLHEKSTELVSYKITDRGIELETPNPQNGQDLLALLFA